MRTILTLSLLLSFSILNAQQVRFGSQSRASGIISIPVVLENVNNVGAISMKIDLDANHFQFVNCIPDQQLQDHGFVYWGYTDKISFGWFSDGFYEYNGEVPVIVQIRTIAGCDSITWSTCQGCCEIADIVEVVIPCTWQSTYLCSKVSGWMKSQQKMN